MKLSFAISYQQTKFDAVGSGNFENALSLMGDLGFDGVEIALRNPELIDPSVLDSKLNRYRLKLAAIGTGQAYVDEDISLTDLDDQKRKEAIIRIKRHIDLASYFDSQVIIGLIRGKILEPALKEKQVHFLEKAISGLCSYAEGKKVILTIEPLNRYECNIFNTAKEVVNIINKINSQYLKVLLDTFHMNIEEGDMFKTFIESKNYLSHVHIADSNRKYPGMGHINFNQIYRALIRIDFNGFLSGEMLPYPKLEIAMKQYITKMKEVING